MLKGLAFYWKINLPDWLGNAKIYEYMHMYLHRAFGMYICITDLVTTDILQI